MRRSRSPNVVLSRLAGVVVLLAGTAWFVAPSAPSGAATTTTTPAIPVGCQHPSGSGTLSLKVDGVTRSVIVKVPATNANLPKALVLNLHGSASTALEQEEFTGMDATADADGFIVAYPQAVIADGTGFDWNIPGVALVGGRAVPAHSPSDVKFIKKLVGILEAKYCVDARKVYATGFSGGAREVSQLACDDATLFAAVAPVSGLRHPTPCRASRPVPIIAFHGTADPIDPFAGNGQAYWTYSVATAAKDWGRQDRCSKVHTSHPTHDVTLVTHGACSQGVVVELYEVGGEGHEWPSGPSLPAAFTSVLGPQSDAVNANQLMWSFFENYRLP